jgi:hypothetical protein
MADSIAITALILSVLSSLGHFIKDINLQHCNCFCVDSDCVEKKIEKEIIKSENKISQYTLKLQKLKQKRNSNSNLTPPISPIIQDASV